MNILISKTYSTIIPDSVEASNGDDSDEGFVYQDEEHFFQDQASLDLWLRDELGYYHDNKDGSYYGQDCTVDHSDGSETTYAIHITYLD